MRQIRKILRDKRGEGYIDVAVMVLCVMLVIALGVRLFPIFITKMQVDNFADELVREAEISGRVGSETSNRQRVLEERTGIHPTVPDHSAIRPVFHPHCLQMQAIPADILP